MNGFFKDKKVLIVGGTGTIGQSLLRHILPDEPTVVRVFSRDEYKQFQLQQQYANQSNIRYLIGDVRDQARLVRAMQDIDYVFHAAAMKHVPACEYNPFEAVQTNVLGTQNVILASLETGVRKTVFTSTDKAIAPTNTYGASKLMAERLISAAQYQAGASQTKFAAVRFGNVMGSRGSVIPLFKQQIEEKRKITVTDQKMSRFMMTVDQAAELTLKAMEYAQGGEVFVLKMPVVRLMDLTQVIVEEMAAKLSIEASDVRIEEIGLRPGEKMYEELMTEEEAKRALELPDMFIIPNEFVHKGSYPGAVPTTLRSYESDCEEILSEQQVRTLLQSAKLLN
ncbi:polysaccharide biosynthesis protein [Cohnella xylanilytica]|uniref:Polysaccharide biosynthesis protein n=1 Tax=Cohnella xylanilytica TaxID=557555 RepID=A0A841TUJ0_9BACL|nr:UDP-N-acetylglucosamine 4,6-dehydratase family protein [Cohnella xylanilytica]MBB6692197.1 polysaccharide biosynthesis protein [Cohnella xylanilytica]